MFGAIITLDIPYDTRDLLFRIDEQLKSHGISYFNKIDSNKLRGYGDAGLGIFEIERKEGQDLQYRLHIDANNVSSAEILENIVLLTFDLMEEEDLDPALLHNNQVVVTEQIKEDCSLGGHTLELLKEEELTGIPVRIFVCTKCSKIEMYKSDRSE